MKRDHQFEMHLQAAPPTITIWLTGWLNHNQPTNLDKKKHNKFCASWGFNKKPETFFYAGDWWHHEETILSQWISGYRKSTTKTTDHAKSRITVKPTRRQVNYPFVEVMISRDWRMSCLLLVHDDSTCNQSGKSLATSAQVIPQWLFRIRKSPQKALHSGLGINMNCTPKTNMIMENQPWISMYILLRIRWSSNQPC